MLKKFTIIILLSGFLIPSMYARQVKLEGHAPGAEGYQVRLIGLKDLISMAEETLSSDVVDSSGYFSLEVDISDTRYGFLDIQMKRAEIYLAPGEHIKVQVDFDPGSMNVSFYDEEPLRMIVETEGINRDIGALNEKYNSFIIEHFNEIYKGRQTSLMDTLVAELEKSAPENKDPYFNSFMEYKIAAAEQFARRMSRQKLADRYLLERPVLYDNVEYNYFFGEFFEKYLLTGSKAVNIAMVSTMVENSYSVKAFLDSISRDPLLSDRALAEYFLLLNLKDLYFLPDFRKENVIGILRELAKTSSFPRHRQIAENIINEVTKLSKGYPAPPFSLPGPEGDQTSLESLKGQNTFLFFFRSDSPVCLHEMDIIEQQMKDYGPNVEVVGISADHGIGTLRDLVGRKNYSFKMLHYGGDLDLLEDYEARTFPLFLILDRNANIYRYPAPWPSENAAAVLSEMQ